MTRSIPLAAALPTLMFAASAAADDGGRPINVAMTGAAERPGPGDPDGTGLRQRPQHALPRRRGARPTRLGARAAS